MIHIETVIVEASHSMRVRGMDIIGQDRHKTISFVRHVAMFIAREQTRASFFEIGRAFGGRHHAAVMAACAKIEFLMKNGDAETIREVERLRRACAQLEAA